MRDFWEDVCVPLLVVVLFLFCGFVALFGMLAAIDYLDCRGFEKGTEFETRWRWSCYVKIDEQWVPKNYVFGEAHEFRLKEKK